jgi:hypothetical protein
MLSVAANRSGIHPAWSMRAATDPWLPAAYRNPTASENCHLVPAWPTRQFAFHPFQAHTVATRSVTGNGAIRSASPESVRARGGVSWLRLGRV